MKKLLGSRCRFSSFLRSTLQVCLLALLGCATSSAQSTAEQSSTSSTTSAAASSQPKSSASTTPASVAPDPSKPPHPASSVSPAPEVVNRQALERHAGKNACKLLLRSAPSAAQVFVNGVLVGESPMLLVVAPGKYQIEMRGSRLDSAERVIDLLPRETREVVLTLPTRYPTRVSIH